MTPTISNPDVMSNNSGDSRSLWMEPYLNIKANESSAVILYECVKK